MARTRTPGAPPMQMPPAPMPPLPMPPVPLPPLPAPPAAAPVQPANPALVTQQRMAPINAVAELAENLAQAIKDENQETVGQAQARAASTAANKSRVGVSKDKLLAEAAQGVLDCEQLFDTRDLTALIEKIASVSQTAEKGRASAAKELKLSVVPASKEILTDRIAQYEAISKQLNVWKEWAMERLAELAKTGNELVHQADLMLAEFNRTGDPKVLNSGLVKALNNYAKLPQAPQVVAAACVEVATTATHLLRAEFQSRVGPGAKPEQVADALLDLSPESIGGGASGTSEVLIARDFDGKVVYAFKPVDGETIMNQGDTLREAITSAMNREFARISGVDLGFPKVEVANVNGRGGALIEGLNGKLFAVESKADRTPLQKQQANDFVRLVPVQEMQKSILSSLVAGDFDIKWDNLFLADDGTSARRFDGGKGFPGPKERADFFLVEQQGARLLPNPEDSLLFYAPFDRTQRLPYVDAPLAPELVQGFLDAEQKLADLGDRLKREAQSACASLSTTQLAQTIDDRTLDGAVRGLKTIVDVIKRNPQVTTAELYAAITRRKVLDMAQETWVDMKARLDKIDMNALQDYLAKHKVNVSTDLSSIEQEIKNIVSADPDSYRDAVTGKQLASLFRTLDRLLAANNCQRSDASQMTIDKWKSNVRVSVLGARSIEEKQPVLDLFSKVSAQLSKEEMHQIVIASRMSAVRSGNNIVPLESGELTLTFKFQIAASNQALKLNFMGTDLFIYVPRSDAKKSTWQFAVLPSVAELADALRALVASD